MKCTHSMRGKCHLVNSWLNDAEERGQTLSSLEEIKGMFLHCNPVNTNLLRKPSRGKLSGNRQAKKTPPVAELRLTRSCLTLWRQRLLASKNAESQKHIHGCGVSSIQHPWQASSPAGEGYLNFDRLDRDG